MRTVKLWCNTLKNFSKTSLYLVYHINASSTWWSHCTATFVAIAKQKPDQLAHLKVIIVLHHNFTAHFYTGYILKYHLYIILWRDSNHNNFWIMHFHLQSMTEALHYHTFNLQTIYLADPYQKNTTWLYLFKITACKYRSPSNTLFKMQFATTGNGH